ncbi:MAG TPA: calcium-binding protein, partial [Allosphingosinicella sp.]
MVETYANGAFAGSDSFQVNGQTAGIQEEPALATLASGGFVAVWRDSFSAIKGQVFDRHGQKVGAELLISNPVDGDSKRLPDVIGLAGGGFAVAWTDPDGWSEYLKIRVFDSAGAALGNETLVSDQPAGMPSLSALSSGGFVVTMNAAATDGLAAQIFGASGNKIGSPIAIDGSTGSISASAGLAGGGFVVTWQDSAIGNSDDSDPSAVRAQIFDSAGAKVGPEILVNTVTAHSQSRPAVTALSGGGFVIGWSDDSSPFVNKTDVKAQIFTASGARVGGEFDLAALTANFQDAVSLAPTASGGFVATWRTSPNSGYSFQDGDIKAQVFDGAGVRLGTEFMVNVGTGGGQAHSQVASFGSGDLVVLWQDFAGSVDSEIKARLLFSTVTGTPGPDTMVGTADRDFFFGGEGDDFLDGGAGADEMAGGAGNDRYVVDNEGDVVVEKPGEGIDEVRSLIWLYTLPDNVENAVATDDRGQGLYGNALDNVLTGHIGWDVLTDNAGGNDRFYGGEGFDSLSVQRYETHAPSTILLDGGADMDVIGFYGARFVDTVTLLGGAGEDHIALQRGGNVTIDAGAGDDRLSLGFLGAQTTITLGTGADYISINRDYGGNIAGGSITVTDFDTGPGGDRLDLAYYLVSVLQGWDPAINPFATQQLRLVQAGSDSVLQVDVDGNAGPGTFTDLVRFQNHSLADFTYFHLGGYHPDGSSPGGITVTGSSVDDLLWGTFQSDLIRGLDGDDEIFGGAGDDRIEGGEGADSLSGQFGSDVLLGEGGKDFLNDEDGGNDLMYGGEGRDTIFVTRTGNVAASTVLLDGGGDWDRLSFTTFGRGYDSATLLGGEGNDDLNVAGRGTILLDGGAGDDHIAIEFSAGLYTVALGTGYDQLYLGRFLDRDSGGADLYDTTINVSGFTPGEIGAETDVLFFRDYLKTVLVGWDGASDPFAAGYLGLAQDGADAVIRLDRDPADALEGPREFIRLKNVDAGALTAYNLNALSTLTITGGDSADTIMAGAGDHRLDGHGGNDRLGGGSGDDVLSGGDGNDMLFSGPGIDRLFGDSGNDVFLFGGSLTGTDQVDGGSGTDQIALQGDYWGANALTLGSNLVSV